MHMKLNFKRLMAMFLSIMMVVGMLPTMVFAEDGVATINESDVAASAVVKSDTWGGIDWTLTEDGTLTIAPTKGTPTTDNSGKWTYEVGQWPEAVIYKQTGEADDIGGWPYKLDAIKIKSLVIEEGVTSIGSFAFNGKYSLDLSNFEGEVVIPSTVTYIGQEAFQGVPMSKLTFAKGGTEELCIAQGAFKNLIITELALPDDRPVHFHAWLMLNSTKLENVTIPATLTGVTGTNHVDYNHNPNAQTDGKSWYSEVLNTTNSGLKTIAFGSADAANLFFNSDNGNAKTEVGAATVANEAGAITYCESLAVAAEIAKSGDTITLLKNTSEEVEIPAGVTLDKGEFTADGVTEEKNYVAQVGDDKFTDIQEAIKAAAQIGGTVTLLTDIAVDTETYTIADGESITLDMNSKKITVTDNAAANYELFYIYGEMTVIGNGTIELTSTHNRAWNAMSAIFHNRGGVLTIQDGTFKNLGGTDMAWVVDNSGNYYGDAITNIKGGTLSSTYTAIRNRMEQNSHGASGKAILNISGGKIEGTTSAVWAQAASESVTAPATGEINVTGGQVGLINTARSAGAECLTTISGGTVDSFKGEVGELKVTSTGEAPANITLLTADGEEVKNYVVDENGVYVEAPAVPVLSGSGTEADPYQIGSVEDLILFRNSVNAGETKYNAPGVYVALTADIDLGAIDNWAPIGTFDYSFDGNFNGNDKVIKNLKISDNTATNGEAYLGFFGITANNVVENFVIENVTISSNGQIVAAAIAYPYYTTVRNITVRGDIAIKGGNYTAGVLAYTRLCTDASNLTVSGNASSYITGAKTVGGVIADIQMNHGLTANYSNFSVSGVNITGEMSVGGISGIIAAQAINGATVKNVTLVCGDARVGVVAGSLGGASTISNVTVENVTGAAAIVGADFDTGAVVEAKIGDKYYTTLEAALAAEVAGDVILLTPYVVEAGNPVVLDLLGKTIVGTDNATGNYGLINIQPGADLTINDSVGGGKITLEATNDREFNAYSSVISNQRGKLTVNGGTIEHLGGTDMAYGIDNLTNGKGTYAETVINGGTIKSTYRAIRQFLNGTEAQNILTVNGGTIEGANKSIWAQNANVSNNPGTLTVTAAAALSGDVLLSGSGVDEWTLSLAVASEALNDGFTVTLSNAATYVLKEVNGTWGIAENPAIGAVAKIGDQYYESVSAALDAAYNAGMKDVVITLTGETNSNTTDSVDLYSKYGNGTAFNTITFKQEDASKTYYLYLLYTGWTTGKVVFEGVNIVVTGQLYAIGKVELINNSTITCSSDTANFVFYGDMVIEPGSKFVSLADRISSGSSLTVDGGRTDGAYNTTADYKTVWLYVEAGNTMTIKNGAYVVASNYEFAKLDVSGTVDVQDSRLDVFTEIIIGANGVFKVDGGSDINTKSITGSGKIVIDVAGMTEGTVKAFENVNLSGFTGTVEVANGNGLKAKIVGGKLTLVKADDPVVAQIGTVNYASIQAAVNAAADGDVITVIADIDLAKTELQLLDGSYDTYFLVEGKTVTIDLNGKTISGAYTGSSMLVGVFSTNNGGHLTLTGNGTVDVTATNKVYSLISNYTDGCSITIENGTYKLDTAANCLIHTSPSANEGVGNVGVVIKGGNFYLGNVGTGTNGQPWIVNANESNARHAWVTGGTYNANVFNQHWIHEVQCGGKYAARDNGDGTWTVVPAAAYVVKTVSTYSYLVGYETINEAIAAAKAGEKVFIFGFDSNGYQTSYNKDLIIDKAITVEGETLDDGYQLVTVNGQLRITADGATVKGLYVYDDDTAAYINAKDVLIEGCELVGASWAGLYQSYTTGTVTFKDSKIVGATYGIHFDGYDGGNIVIDNCVIQGWTSFASTIDKVTISDSEFSDEAYYKLLRFYQDAEVTNTTFPAGMRIDSGDGGTGMDGIDLTFDGCKMADGSDFADVFPDDVLAKSAVYVDGKQLKPAVAKIGDVEYTDLSAAVKAATTGQTVTLLRDINLGTESITIGGKASNVTIDGDGHTITFNDVTDNWYDAAINPGGPSAFTVKNVTIELKNAAPNFAAFDMKRGGTLENVTVNGKFGKCVITSGSTPVTVTGCTFNGADWGIYADGAFTNVNVTGTTFNTTGAALLNGNTVFTGNIIAANSYVESTAAIDVSANFWNGDNATGNAPTADQLKGEKIICDTYYATNTNGKLDDLTECGEPEEPVIKVVVGNETYEYGLSKLALLSKLIGSEANGDTKITLLDNVTLENGIQVAAYWDSDAFAAVSKAVEIDLNGKTLNGFIQINGNVTATIKNGTVNNTSNYPAIDVGGTATLEDMTVISTDKAFRTADGAKLTVKKGTYSSDPTAYVADKYIAVNNGNGTYSVEVGGTWGGIDWILTDDGTLTIAPTKGTPVPDKNAPTKRTYEVGEWREAVIYKSNGSASAIGGYPYDVKAVKTLIIEEGVTTIGSFTAQFPNLTGKVVIPSTVTYIGQEAFHKAPITELIFAADGTEGLCIANGAFKKILIEEIAFPTDREYIHIHHWAFGDCPHLKEAYIPGEITKVWGGEHVDYFDNFNAQSNVTWADYSSIFTGCTAMETIAFETEDARNMFFANNRQSTDKDYIVAYVGLTAYNSLDKAFEVAQNGETVKLIKTVNDNKTVKVPEGATVVLDLNGKTLNGSILAPNANLTVQNGKIVNKDTSVSAIEINAGKLTLTNVEIESARHAVRIDGAVEATINGGKYKGGIGGTATLHAVNASGGAKVTIESGEFYGPKGATADSGAAVMVQANTTVIINGGNFSNGKNNTLVAKTDAVLTIYGGTFDQDPSAYVADGYEAVKGADSLYTVVKSKAKVAQIGDNSFDTLADAIKAAQPGDTIELLAEVNENVTIDKNLTIDGADKNYTGTMTVNAKLNVTIQNVNFVKGCINDPGDAHGYLTVKDCDFDGVDKSIGYAITVRGGDKVVIENSTATNYSTGMLYIPSSVATISVKDVEVSNVAAAFNISYSGNGTFENVELTNVTYGLHVQNHGTRTFTLKGWDADIQYPIYVQVKGTATVNFAFEGANDFGGGTVALNNYGMLVLAATDATLTAVEGLNINMVAELAEDYEVEYGEGVYKAVKIEKVELFSLTSANLKLGSSLTMNFNINTSYLVSDMNHYAEIVRIGADGSTDTVKIAQKDWEAREDLGATFFRFGYENLMAYMMNDTLQVTIYNDKDVAVSEVWIDSVLNYAERLYAAYPSYGTLLVDMLNYGADCQVYFEYATDKLVNSNISDEWKNIASEIPTLTNNQIKGENYRSTSLVCQSTLILTFYFEHLTPDMIAKITYTDAYGENQSLTVDGSEFYYNDSIGCYGVDVPVNAYDAQQLIKCQVYSGDSVFAEASDSVESYLCRAIAAYPNTAVFKSVAKYVFSAKKALID